MISKPVVYLIKCGDFHKIGISMDAKARLKTLSTSSPYEMKLVYCVEAENPVNFERSCHKHFQAKRVRGEWFLLDENDIADFCAQRIQAPPIVPKPATAKKSAPIKKDVNSNILNIKQVCERLRISRSTLYNRIRNSEIEPLPMPPYLSKRGKVLFDSAQIEKLARGN